jgi:hypothetical protein
MFKMQYKIRSRLPILVFADLYIFKLSISLVLRHLIYLVSIKLVLHSDSDARYF